MMFIQNKVKGVTLLEMLMVMVILASVLLMIMTYTTTKTDETRRDVAAIQYEQILNAGLAYYINNSTWPAALTNLQTDKYLPSKTIMNPWRGTYTFYNDSTTGTFTICSTITGTRAATEAGILASKLPMGYVVSTCPAQGSATPGPSSCGSPPCGVVSTVNIPGQNLNNARSVNFAGLYHNSACVPAPVCPNAYSASNPNGMKPAIIVAPVAVTGNFFGTTTKIYPISSFTAYAVGKNSTDGSPVLSPGKCTAPDTSKACLNIGSPLPASNSYWRVCLDVVTENGRIGDPGSVWNEESGTIMAITRCVPNNEPSGSVFTVFESF